MTNHGNDDDTYPWDAQPWDTWGGPRRGVHAAAHAWADTGASVVPAANDGTKAPHGAWKTHQTTRATPDQIDTWFTSGAHDGLGLICGAISGALEMLELEGRAVEEGAWEALAGHAEASGLTDIWSRVTTGYTERTPSGGIHIIYRITGAAVPGNTKIASRPARPDELDDRERKILETRPDKVFPRVLAETRGEGGFVIIAPSNGTTHPSGRAWAALTGDPTTVPTITAGEREALIALAGLLDQMPHPTIEPARPAPRPRDPDGDLRPGDDYNDRATWDQILTPHGWTCVGGHGHYRTWRRPGKDRGISATTGRNDGDNLWVFTTSAEFNTETPYSKFAAYTLLEHGGDYRAATRALAADGYGTPRPAKAPAPAATPLPLVPAGQDVAAPVPDNVTPIRRSDDPAPSDDDPGLAAERAVLGALIAHPDVIDPIMARVRITHYAHAHHAQLWNTITYLHASGHPVDPPAILDELARRQELHGRLDSTYIYRLLAYAPGPASALHHAETVARLAWQRRFADIGQQARNIGTGRPLSVDELATEYRNLEDLIGDLAPDAGRPSAYSRFMVDGAGFLLDLPAIPPAIWGDGPEIAWMEGEALMLNGPNGVGKTTLAGQLVKGRLGLQDEVLGWPVAPGAKKVLYLAMDRPAQIARAHARLFGPEHADTLRDRLVVWKGPPPKDIAKYPDILTELCIAAGADTVVVDSLKDAAIGLTDDETGAGYNRARQLAIVEGIQVLELHHQRKASGDNKKPNTLADVYGSVWLTGGAGSVIVLWGQAGDPLVEFLHLKQPLETIGPLQVIHDHHTGTSSVAQRADLLAYATANRGRLTARMAAQAMFETDAPNRNQVEKARRKLDSLVRAGHLVVTSPGSSGGDTSGGGSTYGRITNTQTPGVADA